MLEPTHRNNFTYRSCNERFALAFAAFLLQDRGRGKDSQGLRFLTQGFHKVSLVFESPTFNHAQQSPL